MAAQGRGPHRLLDSARKPRPRPSDARPRARPRLRALRGAPLALDFARSVVREDEIYMSVNKDNAASLRVQQKNGAYIHHSDDKQHYTRIKL